METTAALFSTDNIVNNQRTILAGDVGATKTLLSLCMFRDNILVVVEEKKFVSKAYSGISDLINEFLKDKERPETISLAVAGPVTKGKAILTNIHWQLDENEIRQQTGIQDISIINDLEAIGYGLPELNDSDFQLLHEGDASIKGNVAIIAPGTGLGEAGLYWDGNLYHPFGTEGGHCDFAPRSADDIALYQYLHDQLDHVSWERLVSGQGILNIFKFLTLYRDKKINDALQQELEANDAAAAISHHATIGDCPVCMEAMGWFFKYLAYESANLVLKLKATGGLLIGGGILPKVKTLLKPADFLYFFSQSGRLNSLLKKIPIRIVLNERTALLGAIRAGRYIKSEKKLFSNLSF